MDSIKKIKEKKSELQSVIANELRKFEKETGVRINKISHARECNFNVISYVYVEINYNEG